MAAMSDAQPSKLNLWMDFLATNKVDENSAPLRATRCARQPLYWWRLDTLTKGAAHETSAGSAAGDGDGRVWGWLAKENTNSKLAVGRLLFVAL